MRYAQIREGSHVDGPNGPRTVLFAQGCSIRCKGCQNAHLWDASKGKVMSEQSLAHYLVSRGNPVTITGGEPTDQAEELYRLMVAIRTGDRPDTHVIIYTGHTIETLAERCKTSSMNALKGRWTASRQVNSIRARAWARAAWAHSNHALAALMMANTVVDGPFVAAKDHDRLQWRGSENQRPIDVRQTMLALRREKATLAQIGEHLVVEDWDTQTLQLTEDGVIGTEGLIKELYQEGSDVRRCGE